jgi:tetratricopeptide (TPR) repeat protein
VCHRILEIDPANEAANSRIVASYLYAGKFHQAAEAGERYLRTFGDKPRVHFFTANAYHCLGDFERAEIHYRRAIELTPDDDLLYDNFGYLYQQNGRPEDARRIWAQQIDVVKRKLEASPRNPGMHLALSRSYGTLGDREGLLKEEQWFARELPENGWTTAALGVSFVKLGDMDRAVAHLRQGFRLGFLNFYWKNVQRAEGVEGLTRSAAGRAFLKEWTQTIQRLHEQY